MTNKERTAVLTGVRQELEKAGFHDYPILAGTATQSIEETLQQLDDARAAGAQWGMVLAPGYFAAAASQQGLIKWYTAVADKSPIPILV
jgi:2-keto-3-deoxy-L-rhamnonate aldolase